MDEEIFEKRYVNLLLISFFPKKQLLFFVNTKKRIIFETVSFFNAKIMEPMKSIAETGHAKNVAVFEKLIAFCTDYGPAYNPSRNELKLDELNKKRDEANAALADVKHAKAMLKQAIADRQTIFSLLKPLATRVLNALKASGISDKAVDSASSINRKIQGRRAAAVKMMPAEENAEETPKRTISVSQQSFDNQVDHFLQIIAILEIQPLYQPNEPDLKIDALKNYVQKLQDANQIVTKAATAQTNALAARDAVLYSDHTGMVDIALSVKKYVLSVFGTNSPEYKRISAFAFRNKV